MKRLLLPLVAVIMICSTAAAQYEFTPDRKLRVAQAIIDEYYVDAVDADTVVAEAIKAMLKTLDPHSAYTTPRETKEFTEPLEGKFSGIGIQFNMLEDTVYVIQTITGGPSERVGIMPGDRILSANDTLIAGQKKANTDVMKVLRGPKGSTANLKVKRGEDIIDFAVIRDDIPLYSIDETFMADPTTGYIRVTRFAEDTPREFREALAKLRAKGMKNLILDLSDNGGGVLGSAVDMASELLPLGTPVVSTKGRTAPPAQFDTEINGGYQNERIVVITNQYSASASEILAGAIQDNDRGLVVGRRTFGKGLVQRPFPFPDGSMVRLTVSRYYTPSGRCIQKPYEKGHSDEYQYELLNRYQSGELWSADSIQKVDSLKYYTLKNRRPVYGGGGIIPDVFVPVDTSNYSVYYRDLVAKGIINRTCISYVDGHRSELIGQYPDDEAFQTGFNVPEAVIADLRRRADEAKIEFNEEQWERSRLLILAIMKGIIARDLYENASYFRAISPFNSDFQEALRLINDTQLYDSLLKGAK